MIEAFGEFPFFVGMDRRCEGSFSPFNSTLVCGVVVEAFVAFSFVVVIDVHINGVHVA